MTQVVASYHNIHNAIPRHITLTLATKSIAMETINEIVQIGHTSFAENYIQEAYEKWENTIQDNKKINLKLIGKFQSNKINDALNLFSEIHSVHSLELAHKIAQKINSQTKTNVFYAQINIGEEEQKSGIMPCDVINFMRNTPILISGLMCIPPSNIEPSIFFFLMQNIRRKIYEELKIDLKLSMGMSGDYQRAINMGSNEIRIGSAIFGNRN